MDMPDLSMMSAARMTTAVYSPPKPGDSRAPCPALNTLANYGYLPSKGRDIGFGQLFSAVSYHYNLSCLLTFFLVLGGFLCYGTLTYTSLVKPWTYRLTIDLDDLAAFGHKIAHPASLVHPDYPSHKPDSDMVDNLVNRANAHMLNISGEKRPGLTLYDLASIRIERENSSPVRLSKFHKFMGCGESALTWLMLRERLSEDGKKDLITPDSVRRWLGEESFPDWWLHARPAPTVGVLALRRRAAEVKEYMGQ